MKSYGDSPMSRPSTPNQDAERIAESLLVDAMLRGHYQDNETTTKQRIGKALEQLEASPHIIPLRWTVGLSTAVAAILVICFLMILSSPQPVQADFESILVAFDRGDKTFQIDISYDANQPTRSWGRGSQRSLFKSPRRGMRTRRLDGASLYVRDRSYVVSCRGPRGGKIIKGFDGQDSWLIHPWRGTISNHDPNLLDSEIPDHINSLLFLNLRDTLHQIRKDYHLAGPTEGTLEDGQTRLNYFLAERISRRGKTPRQIELWVDPLTDELQQIIFTGVSFHSPSNANYTLQITLTSTEPLSENWFTQEAHARLAL